MVSIINPYCFFERFFTIATFGLALRITELPM